MKNNFLLITISILIFLSISCDEVYDYDLNDTTWDISVYWNSGFYQGEPTQIKFFSDGTTSWGGTWEKTDELTFKWVIYYESNKATYYAQFKKDLTQLVGHCENTLSYSGEFNAKKISH